MASEGSPTKRLRQMADAVAEGDLGLCLGFLPSKRIQVLWCLSEAEGQEETEKWWPATVVGKTSRFHKLPKEDGEEEENQEGESLEQLPVYEVEYDELGEFPAEISAVCLLDDHHMLDIEQDVTLLWREEGSKWEAVDEEDDQAERVLPAPLKEALERHSRDPLVCKPPQGLNKQDSELIAREFVQALIGDVTSKHVGQFRTIPMHQQMSITDNVIRIREKLVGKVATCLNENGAFSEDDAKRIVQELQTPS